MNKLILLMLLNVSFLFSLNLTLKEKVNIFDNIVYIKDIVYENVDDNIGRIFIHIRQSPTVIKSNTILNELYKNSIYNVNIIGNYTIVNIIPKEEECTTDSEIISENKNAVDFLKNYLTNYLNSNFNIKISVQRVEPYIDIFNLNKEFSWEIEKIEKGLKDIIELKKIFLIVDNKKYTVKLNVSVYTDVYIAKKQFLKGDILTKNDFIKKYLDISTYKEPENIVFNIEDLKNLRFVNNINAGDVLRWKDLSKIPLVLKDEKIKAIIKRGNFEITLSTIVLNDGYENEKIKIKIKNGKELIGILKNNNGEIYVEL